MLLQVVSVIVAPFGITCIASAVANCSDGPWAVARLPPARAIYPRRRLAINSAAFRTVRARRGCFYFRLHRTLPSDGNSVQQPPRSTAAAAPALALQPWFSVGFASWTRYRDWRWRQQRCGLNGKTSRPPCGIEGNHHEGDRFRTLCRPGQSTGRDQDCDQNSHRAIFADSAASCRHVGCVLSALPQRLFKL